MKITPELYCSNLNITRNFYLNILKMEIKYERPEDMFIYFIRDQLGIMVEQFDSPDRKWITGDLQKPFGRGINFQWEIRDIDSFYIHIKELSPSSIFLEIEEKEYNAKDRIISQKQFVVQDPDGYLFRFCNEICVKGT